MWTVKKPKHTEPWISANVSKQLLYTLNSLRCYLRQVQNILEPIWLPNDVLLTARTGACSCSPGKSTKMSQQRTGWLPRRPGPSQSPREPAAWKGGWGLVPDTHLRGAFAQRPILTCDCDVTIAGVCWFRWRGAGLPEGQRGPSRGRSLIRQESSAPVSVEMM